MSASVTQMLIEQCVGAIALPLYEGVSAGLAEATTRLDGFAHLDQYPALVPILARHAMRNYWVDAGVSRPWHVGGQPHLMGQVILTNADAAIELRLLKERSQTYPGGVPVAGRNPERQHYWAEPPLPIEMPRSAPEERTRLLLLWDQVVEGDEKKISVRVVHTLAPGYYGSRVPIDMSFNIEPTGQMFAQLTFEGEAQDEDLFADIPKEDNEGDEGESIRG